MKLFCETIYRIEFNFSGIEAKQINEQTNKQTNKWILEENQAKKK